MPLKRIGDYTIIEENIIYKEKYWPILSDFIATKYGQTKVSSATEVQIILKDCFLHLCNQFSSLIKKENRASFFVFVQNLHEDSIEIWRKQLNGNQLDINQSSFSASRRMMKYILEQGCTLDLVGCDSFLEEMLKNETSYTSHLEELIYLGSWAFAICEHIAQSQICPNSISTEVVNGTLTIYIDTPFNTIFDFVSEEFDKHKHDVVISDCIIELKEILSRDLKTDYGNLCANILEQFTDPKQRFAFLKLDVLIKALEESLGFSKEIMEIFYSGLMITKDNVLNIEKSILKTQDSLRYMYRPILKYKIDGEPYWMIGANKWSESLTQLTTNCIPFGQHPIEWKKLKPLNTFFVKTSNNHDLLLEQPAVSLIEGSHLKVDTRIKVFKKHNNQGVNIEKEGIGEIDICFIDEDEEIIFVVECKHNKARYEFNNWKRDISNFRESFETQLGNKYSWVYKNKQIVLEHFEVKYGSKIPNTELYKVIPLFLINAPTLYMFDSDYLVMTLYDFKNYLQLNYKSMAFDGVINGKKIRIEKPYFKNIAKAINGKA